MNDIDSRKRVLKNTLMLYFRQFLLLFISLYSVRIVLDVLGAEDYGIYNVIAGVVTMFSFLTTAMANANQRFFSFSLGKKDSILLNKYFNITLEIYFIIIFIIIFISESFGIWFIQHKLKIPFERINATIILFQFSILAFVFNLLASPYMALIMSYENMSVFAKVSIVEGMLKLLTVFSLKIIYFDKLISYGMLLSLTSFLLLLIYFLYCKTNYKNIRFSFSFDKQIFKEIFAFTGWCLFGTSAGVVKNQIINVLLNMKFGTIVNAARAVAMNVNNAVISFATNFNMAVKPQIVKKYSVGEKKEAFDLVFQTSKLSFLLLYIFILPLFLEMNYVLTIWLKDVPAMTVIFTRLFLIEAMFDALSFSLQSLSQANGNMRLYQSVVGGVLLLNLPFAYLVIRLGYDAYSVQFVAIIIGFLSLILRVFINKLLTGMSVSSFFKLVLCPCCIVSLISAIVPTTFYFFMDESFVRLLVVIVTSLFSICLSFLYLGLSKTERKQIILIIKDKFRRNKI